jgi:CheY-like chemotaxis protein
VGGDIQSNQLLRYAQDLATMRRNSRALRRRIDAQALTPHLILVADDDPLLRALLSLTLSSENYDVREASTGAEAIAVARSEQPALVVLDRHMPDPDGITVCKTIKDDPVLQQIWVIMVTADPGDEQPALAAGADEYLNKPFSPSELLQRIDYLLLRR